MPWYRLGTVVRWGRTLAAGALIELLGQWIGVSWALGLVAVLYAVSSLRLNAAQVQAQAAHQRLNVLVPQVTTIGATASNANTTANNALPKAGGTITGGLNINSGLAVAGNHSVGGNQSVSGSIQGNGMTSLANIAANGSIGTNGEVDGGVVKVNGLSLNIPQPVGGWPMSTSQAWGVSVINLLNATAGALATAHVLDI